jgi:hypothetical protein
VDSQRTDQARLVVLLLHNLFGGRTSNGVTIEVRRGVKPTQNDGCVLDDLVFMQREHESMPHTRPQAKCMQRVCEAGV